MKSLVKLFPHIKFIVFVLLIVSSLTLMSAYSIHQFKISKTHRTSLNRYVEGEVLVKYKKNTPLQTKLYSINARGGVKLKEFGTSRLFHVKVKHNQSVNDAIDEFSRDPNVEYVQPNYIYKASSIPNDPDYYQLWGLKNTEQTVIGGSYPQNNPGTSGCDMDLEKTWDVVNNCSSVIVAVLDSGVNYNHQDIADNMWAGNPHHGYDFIDSDDDPMDLNGHGTHVAGTIGARGNNNIGTTGVCWNVKIMAVRVLNGSGMGTTAQIKSGLDYAIANNANVINMSIGCPDYDSALYESIGVAKDNGIIIVAAAGNETNNVDTGDPVYPCKYNHDNIICVAALDQAYQRTSFSNYGQTSVDIGAPGANIRSLWNGQNISITDDFTSGWMESPLSNSWSSGVKNIGGGNYNMLFIPENWPSSQYTNNINHQIFKNFTLDGDQDYVKLLFYAAVDTELNYDFFRIRYSHTAGNPFPAGTLIENASGTTNGYIIPFEYEMTNCIGSTNCTVGFQLQTNASIRDLGVGIMQFRIDTLKLNINTYKVIDGTSMATPHVSGLAALLKAYNQNYTYADIVNSIKMGGENVASMNGITTTGKAANAWGSICYIQTPTDVEASVVQ